MDVARDWFERGLREQNPRFKGFGYQIEIKSEGSAQ